MDAMLESDSTIHGSDILDFAEEKHSRQGIDVEHQPF